MEKKQKDKKGHSFVVFFLFLFLFVFGFLVFFIFLKNNSIICSENLTITQVDTFPLCSLDAGYTERYMGLDTPEDNQAGYNVR